MLRPMPGSTRSAPREEWGHAVTFAADEASAASGQPVELYLFQAGADRWAYTSGDEAKTYNGQTYTPAPIRRSAISLQSGSAPAGATLTIEVPGDFEIARQFVGFVPARPLGLTIYRYHRGSPSDIVPPWSGRVRGCSWSDGGARASLQCEGIDASLKRQALRRGVGLGCEHMLYDTGCKVSALAYRKAGTVSAISGTQITAGVIGSEPNGWWVSGYARVEQRDYRMIIAHSGSTITVLSPFETLDVGEQIEVFAGCARTWDVCGSKFGNRANYGGFPFWPPKNPWKEGLK